MTKHGLLSPKQQNKEYVVQYIGKCTNCKLRCSKCRACIHMYTCSCLDSVTHTAVCKHIHLIHIKEGDRLNNIEDDMTQTSIFANKGCSNALNSDQYLSQILRNTSTTNTIQTANDQATSKLHQIQAQVSQCDDMDALKSVIHHLDCAIVTINAMTNHPIQKLSVTKHVPPNTNKDSILPKMYVNRLIKL